MVGFWDVAPKPPLLSYLRTTIFGPSATDTAEPPQRLPTTPEGIQAIKESSPPAGVSRYRLVEDAVTAKATAVFLRNNFVGKGGGPAYILDPARLLRDGCRTLIVTSITTGAIVGVITSAPIGQLRRNTNQAPTPFTLRIIKDFCVAPQYRSRGLGSYLLFAVWEDTRRLGKGECRGEDAVIFLKEGAPIPKAGPTLASATWMYRRMREAENIARVQQVPWSALSNELRTFTAGRTDVLFNIPGRQPRDSVALIYRTYRGAVLAAYTRAHQQHPSDGEMICYETGWLEHGELLDAERRDAGLQLSAAAAGVLGCYWVWAASRSTVDAPWAADGPFHWYAFKWTPGFYGNVKLWLLF
jgi:hypothetical protein